MNIIACECNGTIKNSFVYLSKDIVDSLDLTIEDKEIIVLDNISTGERVMLNWKGGVIDKEKRFQVSNELMPLSDGSLFKVSVIKCSRVIEKMRLVPLSGRDYSAIERHSDYFEENLLNQIQVVSNNQVIPFYLLNQLKESKGENALNCLMLKVEIDNEYGFISSDCEISISHIKDDADDKEEISDVNEVIKKRVKVEFNKKKGLLKVPQLIDSNRPGYSYISYASIPNNNTLLSRLCDYSLITKSHNDKVKQHDNQFPYLKSFWMLFTVHEEKQLKSNTIALPSYAALSTCLFQNDYVDLKLYSCKDIIVNIGNYLQILLDNLLIDYCQLNDSSSSIISPQTIHSYLADELNKMDLLVFTCDFIYIIVISNTKIVLRFTVLNKRALQSFFKITHETLPIILSQPFCSSTTVKIRCSHELKITYSYTLLSKSNRYLNLCSQLAMPLKYKLFNRQVILENTANIIKQIELYYSGGDYRNCSLMLLPKIYDAYPLCKVIINKLSYLEIHYTYLDMNMFNYNDDNFKQVKEYLKEMTSSILSVEESKKPIVVIKGIENLIETQIQEQEDNDYAINRNNSQTVKLIGYYLTKCLKKIKATSNSYILMVSLGNNCITHAQNMHFAFLTNNSDIQRFSVGYLTSNQLKALNDHRYNYDDENHHRSNLIIGDIVAMETHQKDISEYIPLNSQNNYSSKRNISKSDFSLICNMESVKNELIDTISLSLKAKKLFSEGKLPIRFSSGVLLIGPSGCGKSLIASSIEKQFRINFYSIKCTDVLSKYIGQSEYIIRQYFSKAKENSPSVLFFDELEALAPVRGTGSSGVTDRIVNQILTYLDGIESREDVFVIGASSNPNMIDPAMLRPGRLDKIILCDYPTKDERMSLIECFIKQSKCKWEISPQLIETISNKSLYYTPADLNAIVYNAYLKSVKASISKNNSQIIVHDEEVQEAFDSFKKHINRGEIEFYKKYQSTTAPTSTNGFHSETLILNQINNNDTINAIGTKSTLI